jgi:hypothetical protein
VCCEQTGWPEAVAESGGEFCSGGGVVALEFRAPHAWPRACMAGCVDWADDGTLHWDEFDVGVEGQAGWECRPCN